MISTRTKYICLGIFLFHLSISHVLLPLLHKTDAYPFYYWNLFSFSPAVQSKVFIRVLELNGKKVEPVQIEFQHRNTYPAKAASLIPYQIHRVGENVMANGRLDSKGRLFKKEMEANLFYGHQSAVYELAMANINVRDLLKSKKIETYQSLGKFTYKARWK